MANSYMKLLWVNPSFLDYRIPLYNELYKKCNGEFYLIFSENRVPQRCIARLRNLIGNNAVSIKEGKSYRIGKSSGFANSAISIPFPRHLYKEIKHIKPDVIIAEGFFQFTPWAVLFSVLNHVPLIISYEKTSHTERNCPWWRRMYRRFICLFVDAFVVNGTLSKEYLINSMAVPSQKIFTGSMCADSLQLAKDVSSILLEEKIELTRSLSIDSGGLTYIFVGRIIKLKGIKYLLQAWIKHIEKYASDNLLIVGGGELLTEYKFQYGEINSIHFLGEIDYSQIYKYYSVADVFVIPTLEDNWSLVVPEAMACGLPIACSIYNGCYPELVHPNENGFLFDPFKESTIIETLEKFHKVDLVKFGTESKIIESNFNPPKTAENIYKAVSYVYKK